MTFWIWMTLALMTAGLLPALVVAARGEPLRRLVGLELATPVAVLVLMAVAQVASSSADLVVPLVLAVLAYAGTLVFVRLLRR
ncbi:MAG: hypothetical protein ACTHOD_02410 [Motilibacteraceae bacterium]